MLQAELHGKLPSNAMRSEDVLTSNVFGIMKNCDRNIFLKSWLESIGLTIGTKDVEQAEFSFWPIFEDRTEPDVVIEMPSLFIVIEAKYLSDLGNDETQLQRQILQGVKAAKGKQFLLICITSDFDHPKILPKDMNIYWTSWQKLFIFLNNVLKNPKDNCSTMWMKDLKELLDNKGLTGFTGFRNIYMGEPMSLQKYLDMLNHLGEQFSNLILEVDSELKKLDFKHYVESEFRIERNGTKRAIGSPYSWITTYYGFAWKEKIPKSNLNDVIYFLKFWFNCDNPKLWIGTFIFSNRSEVLTESLDLNSYMEEQIIEKEFENPTLNPKDIGIKDEKYISVGSLGWNKRELIYYEIDISKISERKDIPKIVSMFNELRTKVILLGEKLSAKD